MIDDAPSKPRYLMARHNRNPELWKQLGVFAGIHSSADRNDQYPDVFLPSCTPFRNLISPAMYTCWSSHMSMWLPFGQ